MTHVNILTIHKEPNYGAVLQAYALYRAVETLGHHPRMINLSMDYRQLDYSLKNRVALPAYRLLKGYSHCFKLAEKFSKKHCPNYTRNFHTMKELEGYPWDEGDAYLIGSDQVWNPEITGRLSNAFCFSFLNEHIENRFAYAASFGNIKDEDKRKAQLDMAALARFKKIAVRESFGVEFLRKNGIEATEVIDPTLLLDSYNDLLPRPVRERDEILFLSLSDTKQMNGFVNDLSKQTSLPVRKLYGYLQPERKKNLRFRPIEEWLYSIACAKMVVTDSFHATVFSIIFHRPFFVYLSEPSKAFRITNLLDHLKIEGRIVSDATAALSAPAIDYAQTDKLLGAYRESSIDYLKSILPR